MKKLLLIVPLAAALGLSACNMNNEVQPEVTLEENPDTGLNNINEDDDTRMPQEDRLRIDATSSPMSSMMPEDRTIMEDDDTTIRMEGGVDTEM